MSCLSHFTILSIATLLALGVSSPAISQGLQSDAPAMSIRAAIQNLPPATASVASHQSAVPPTIVFPLPKHSGMARRAIVGLAVLGGMIAGAYFGTRIENTWFPCYCDDPGLKGFLIGAPAGAIAAGIVAYRFTR
jgi:hypothetical protein